MKHWDEINIKHSKAFDKNRDRLSDIYRSDCRAAGLLGTMTNVTSKPKLTGMEIVLIALSIIAMIVLAFHEKEDHDIQLTDRAYSEAQVR